MTTANAANVAVIGGGIIGVMTAWQLAKRSVNVSVFDQWNSPNDRGASAGESRIFRTIYKEGSEYVPLLKKSYDLWAELQQNQNTQFLQMCGGITIGTPETEEVRAVIDCATSEALEYEVLDKAEVAKQFPQFWLDENEVGVYDPSSGIFRPEAAVLAARREAEKFGTVFNTYTRVLNMRPLKEGVVLDTVAGSSVFDKVVVATGPWVNELTGFSKNVVQPLRLVAMWFPAKDLELHSPANMPISIRRSKYGGFSCFPVMDGFGVKILPHHLPWKPLAEVDDLPRFVESEIARSTEYAVSQLMPGLDPVPFRVSTWTEGFTSDNTPIVGASDFDPRVLIAAGMSGQGFKFSPMIGSIVSDLVLDETSADSLSTMLPQRFSRSAQ